MKANKFGSKRTKRYAAGGLNVEDMKQGIASGFRAEAPGDVPNEGEDGIDAAIRIGTARKNATGDTPKSESFAAAFKRNRAAGEKGFEFNGKKYTTEVKGSGAKPKSGATAMRPSDAEIADIKTKQMAMRPSDAEIADIKAKQSGLGMKSGGKVKSASSRADGCAIRGKTKA